MANGSYIDFIICEVSFHYSTPTALGAQEVVDTPLTSHGAKENAEIFFICQGGGMVNEF